jgi:glycosyltransferase involved in cell wall biosynthesis
VGSRRPGVERAGRVGEDSELAEPEPVPGAASDRDPAQAAALAAILDDPELADRLRSAAGATVERFSWAWSAAEYRAIYASLGDLRD